MIVFMSTACLTVCRAAAREAAKAEKAAAKAAAKASAAAAAAAATEAAKAAKEAAAGSAPVAAGAPSAEVSREAAEVASPQCDDEAAAAAPSDGEGKLQEEDSEKPVSELTGEEKTEVVSGSVIDEVSEPVCEGKVVSELVTEEKDEPVHVVQQEPVEDDDVEEDVEEPPTAEESVDVGVVQKAVEAEARARAEAEKEEAVMKLQVLWEGRRQKRTKQPYTLDNINRESSYMREGLGAGSPTSACDSGMSECGRGSAFSWG